MDPLSSYAETLVSFELSLTARSWKMLHLPQLACRFHCTKTIAPHYYQPHKASVDNRHEQSERPVAGSPVCSQDGYISRFETLHRATLWHHQAIRYRSHPEAGPPNQRRHRSREYETPTHEPLHQRNLRSILLASLV